MSLHLKLWMAPVLWAAAVYNICWGMLVIVAPGLLFRWAGMPAPNYPG